jgi:methyl-accepting chemotaxis protein
MPIGRKLLVGFGVVTAMMVTVGVVGITQLSASHDRLEYTDSEVLAATSSLRDVDGDFSLLRLAVADLALASDEEAAEAVQERLVTLDEHLDTSFEAYQATDMVGRQALVDQLTTDLADYREARDEIVIPLALGGDIEAFNKARAEHTLPLIASVTDSIDQLLVIEDEAAHATLEEGKAAYERSKALIIALLVVAALVSVTLAVVIGRAVAGPLGRTVAILKGLAEGRLDQRLDASHNDEVGQMATALNTAMEMLGETMTRISASSQSLASASEELSAISSQMSGSAEQSATQASMVSSAAEEVSANVQTVAAGTEEMSAAIREIATSASTASDVAAEAVRAASSATSTVDKLGRSTDEITAVLKVITSIAEQTNLLALNATIESARAGDAGKGFAVVASEVKELAQQTAQATGDITRRIEAIQGDSAEAAAAISSISEVIDAIHSSQATIAAAVEEQTATTNEMSRNVAQAADGSSGIAANMATVAQAASDTTGGAHHTAEAADELARMATDLQGLVGRFRF